MKLVIDKGLNCPDEAIQAQWDDICTRSEQIDCTGFGKVYECLNETILQGCKHPVLFPYTDDEAAITKALEMTGKSNDEAFCNRFWQHYRLFVEGKAIQAKGLSVMASVMPEFGKQAGGWYFVPISIIAPKEAPEIQAAITSVLAADAKAGTGLFANKTQIPKEDEALDEYLCVEAYDCKGTFATYYRMLQRYNVVGKDEALFNRLNLGNNDNGTRLLFAALKQCACIIKDNTDSPNKTRNKLNEAICCFDNVPVWGLLFQMLLLDGLCKMLESLNINEGDNGFDEAQALCDWLVEGLLQKEILFCCQYYGDGDLKTLKPLCEYLCTTEAGKAVQQWVKAQYYPEQRETAQESPLLLPDGLHTDEAVKVFEAAIKAGYMTKQGDCYKWNKSNALLAYMCGRLYCKDSIETSPITKELEYKKGGYKDFPETTICTLFNVKNLGQSRRQMERPPKGYTDIDRLF